MRDKPLTRGSALPLLLVIVALLAAGGLWLLLHEPSTPGGESLAPYLGEADTEGLPSDAQDKRASTARAGPIDAGSEPGLPRVLPPDAAVEDVRDALALQGEERDVELTRAYGAIGRLATEGGRVIDGIRSYAQGVEDETVRGVVIAATGAQASASHRAWLAERLADAPTTPERIGALIALAYPLTPDAVRQGEGARAATLGGLSYRYVALPAEVSILNAARSILRTSSKQEALDSVPVLRKSIEMHPEWADRLVAGDAAVAWLQSLDDTDRVAIVKAALEHRPLSADARRVLMDLK